MTDEPEVSAPGAFARPRKRITLPDPAPDGTPLVVEILRPEDHEAYMAMGQFPPYVEPPKPPKGQTMQQAATAAALRIQGQREAWRQVAKVGLVAPAFAFDAPEEGKPFWGDLTEGNQEFIAVAIMELTPMFNRLTKAAEAAESTGRFPDEQGGLAAGVGPVPGAAHDGLFDPAVARARQTPRRGGGKAGAQRARGRASAQGRRDGSGTHARD